jgi:hypothetical protein
VEVTYTFCGVFDSVEYVVVAGVARFSYLVFGYTKVVYLDTVELTRELPKGVVAIFAHLFDYRAHVILHIGVSRTVDYIGALVF